jgi:uncharacterized SAM-binding protein YcdF (DUF218 family)
VIDRAGRRTAWEKGRSLAVHGLALFGAVVLLIMYSPVSEWLVAPLVVSPTKQAGDAIILLTAWSSPDGILNEPGLRRTVEAARLHARGAAGTIVISGRNRDASAGPTASVMSELLGELGVHARDVILETESTNTHESAVNVARLARARGWSAVVVVSDAKDMRRALASFARQSLRAEPGVSASWELRSEGGPDRLLKFQHAAHE